MDGFPPAEAVASSKMVGKTSVVRKEVFIAPEDGFGEKKHAI